MSYEYSEDELIEQTAIELNCIDSNTNIYPILSVVSSATQPTFISQLSTTG